MVIGALRWHASKRIEIRLLWFLRKFAVRATKSTSSLAPSHSVRGTHKQIKKDKSLSKYAEFEDYKKKTWMFVPFLW